jgi:ADP-ribose pyrophosphatase YjhB (NUDIX family)|tara:strand:+ start:233 stop:676 length:444 start_codon:yes stop_codon:yes gene_type:complete
MPVKWSVALAVVQSGAPWKVLLVRRPDDDEELPGMWGLPAASCRTGETLEIAARRIGPLKLGAGIILGKQLASGKQVRASYILEMSLFAATLDQAAPSLSAGREKGRAVTLYADWRWGDPRELADSARRGSLCCRLLMEALPSFEAP